MNTATIEANYHAGYTRAERYHAVRKQRRRQGIIWAIFATLLLVTAWDLASRIDEVAYNATSLR